MLPISTYSKNLSMHADILCAWENFHIPDKGLGRT